MARKPTLSPSRISTYLACPVKYKWTYLDSQGKFFVRSRSYFSFGSSLHNVLQRFHDSNDAGVSTVNEAIAALEENWITAGYNSPEEASIALAEGREIIEQYVEIQATLGAGAQTLFTEKQLRKDMGDFTLLGRIDRIDELDDGAVDVIDYKSGRESTDENELRNDLAMNCYQLLVRHMYPEKRVFSSIISLKTGHKITIEPTASDLELFESDLVALGTEILNREFEEIEPLPKQICTRCDFLPLCQRSTQFSEKFIELQRQREPNP